MSQAKSDGKAQPPRARPGQNAAAPAWDERTRPAESSNSTAQGSDAGSSGEGLLEVGEFVGWRMDQTEPVSSQRAVRVARKST
jgi:hypothetical protein